MLTLEPIGVLRTPYPDKRAVPRQPGLVPAAIGHLRLRPGLATATEGLEGCSHVWLIWWFDQSPPGRAKVRPPRLGGHRRLGVFATRAPVRPNPIGLSVCPLLGIEEGGALLVLGGVDLADRTPILDVKPYLAWVDAVPDARLPWIPGRPEQIPVALDPPAEAAVADRPRLRALIVDVIAQDPRPATHKAEHRTDGRDVDRAYATELADIVAHWRYEGGAARVIAVEPADGGGAPLPGLSGER